MENKYIELKEGRGTKKGGLVNEIFITKSKW